MEPATQHEESAPAAEPAPPRPSYESLTPGPLRTFMMRFGRFVPWASFVAGVVGAVVMDRRPSQAWLIALSSIGIWVAVLVLRWLSRVERDELGRARRMLLSAARLSALLGSQSLVQLQLFFTLPLFFYAAALDIGHGIFLVLLSALGVMSLWDPLTERWFRHRMLISVLPAAGSFAALTAVLPALGLSTQVSLWIAVAIATAGVPLLAVASAPPQERLRSALMAGVIALGFALLLLAGGTRIVPAAPLRLVRAEIGTELEGKWVKQAVRELPHAPPRLHCATAIASPLGLKDRLFHVWRKDGALRARVALKIVGGRGQGFRTHSRIAPGGAGVYSCTVETASGQVLGARRVRIL
jgi:hypothetical protein